MKLKKKRKSKRMLGHGRGTHGWGARKKHISSGNQGGMGMAGTGKMAGHKFSLLQKLYPGQEYLGKQGITSRSTERIPNLVINVGYIGENLDAFNAKSKKDGVLDFSEYKILGEGEIKSKVIIKAKSASKSAVEKIEKAGGKVILPQKASEEKAEKESKEKKKEA